MDDPPEAATTTTTPTGTAAPGGSTPDGTAEPGDTVPGDSTAETAPPTLASTTTIAPLADLPECPVDALDCGRRTGGDHVLARPLERTRDVADRADRRVQRQPGPRARRPAEPDELRLADRQVHPVEPGQPPDRRAVSRVHAAVVRRVRHADPDRGLPRSERLRHGGVPPAHGRRVHVRRHPVVDAVQRQQPGPLLQPRHVRGRRSRSRRQPDHARRAACHVADDRRLRSRLVRMGRRQRPGLRWRLVPRAVVRPSRRALRRQRQRSPRSGHRRCCTTARPASTC